MVKILMPANNVLQSPRTPYNKGKPFYSAYYLNSKLTKVIPIPIIDSLENTYQISIQGHQKIHIVGKGYTHQFYLVGKDQSHQILFNGKGSPLALPPESC